MLSRECPSVTVLGVLARPESFTLPLLRGRFCLACVTAVVARADPEIDLACQRLCLESGTVPLCDCMAVCL
jgi:hypothetical protein